MDFKQLRAFLTVADSGSVTRASQLLNLVQPAVSRQLRLLEEDVGTALFQRDPHGMALTEAGHALMGYARRVMLELERARAELRSTGVEISGLVTVGLLPSTCDLLSSPLMSAVTASYPGIRLRIAMGYAGTLAKWLETGEVDAALLYESHRSASNQITPLVVEPLWVYGSVAAKLRRDRPVPLASLAGKPIILPSAPHGIRSLVAHACSVSNVELSIAAETNAMSVQRRLAMDGHGLTILPTIAVADDVANKVATAAPLSDPAITRTIVLATPANRALPKHVRATVDTLAECIEKAVTDGRWFGAEWLG